MLPVKKNLVNEESIYETFPSVSEDDGYDSLIKTQIEDLTVKNIALEQEIFELKKRIKINEEEYDNLIKNTDDKKETLSAEIEKLKKEHEKLRKKFEELETESHGSEAKIKELFCQLDKLIEENKEKNGAMIRLERVERNLSKIIERQEKQISIFQSDETKLKRTIEKMEKDRIILLKEVNSIQALFADSKEKSIEMLLEKQGEIESLNEKLKDKAKQLESKQTEIEQLKNEIEELNNQTHRPNLFDELQASEEIKIPLHRIQELEEALVEKEKELIVYRKELATTKNLLSTTEINLQASEKQLALRGASIIRLTEKLDETNSLLTEKKAELQKCERELKQLEREKQQEQLQMVTLNTLLYQTVMHYEGPSKIQAPVLENTQSLDEMVYFLSDKRNCQIEEDDKIFQIKERLNKLNTFEMIDRIEMRSLLEDIKIIAETNPVVAANFLESEYKGKHIGLYIAELMKENPRATEPLAKFYISITYKLIVSEHIEKFRALDILFGEFSMQLARHCMKTPELMEFFSRSLILMTDKSSSSVSKIIFSTISAIFDRNRNKNNEKSFYNTLKHGIPCDLSFAPAPIFKAIANFIKFAPMSPKRELAKKFHASYKKMTAGIESTVLENEREQILTEIEVGLNKDSFISDLDKISNLQKNDIKSTMSDKSRKTRGFLLFFRKGALQSQRELSDASLVSAEEGPRNTMTL